jgi:hypothetical protein
MIESGVKHHKINKQTNIIIEEFVPSQESEQSCICVRDIYFVSFYDSSV